MPKIIIKTYQPAKDDADYALHLAYYKGVLFCDFCTYGNKISQYRFNGYYTGKEDKALFGSLNSIVKHTFKTI